MKRVILFLMLAACVPACAKEHARQDLNPQGTPYVSPMGYTVYFRGPVEVPVWDYFPSDPGYLTRDQALVALDQTVEAFIASHPLLNPDTVRFTLRNWKFGLVDDYVFKYGTNSGDFGPQDWAKGMTDYVNRAVVLATWTRGTTQYSVYPEDPDSFVAGVPVTAPPHTIRAPGTYPWWRYGTRPLVPAANYELENVFNVPH